MEKETNQDSIKSLPWDNFMGNSFGLPYQRENKTKDQSTTPAGKKHGITTSAGKENNADSRLHSY